MQEKDIDPLQPTPGIQLWSPRPSQTVLAAKQTGLEMEPEESLSS